MQIYWIPKQCYFLSISTEVSFSAKMSNVLEINNNDIIKFDDVLTNVGNAYNPTSGKFVAPYNGSYLFTVVIMNQKLNDPLKADLMLGKSLT